MKVQELKDSDQVSDAVREDVLRRIEYMKKTRKRHEDMLEQHLKDEAEFLAMDIVEASESPLFSAYRHMRD